MSGPRGCSRRSASRRLRRRARVRLVARQDRPDGYARRARRPRGRHRGRNDAAAERRQRAAAIRTTPAASPRLSGCSPTRARPASRSRTTTRRRAGSTTSASRRSASPWRPRPPTRSAWCSPARAENHIRGVDDLDDTIARLVAYRDAGADCSTRPASPTSTSPPVVDEVGAPVNVLALPAGPRSASWRRSACGGSRPAACSPVPPTARWSQAPASCARSGTSRWTGSAGIAARGTPPRASADAAQPVDRAHM